MYIITEVANQIGISAMLLTSVCTVETGLRNVNNYTDHQGASLGVCQVQLRTARSIKPWLDRLALQQPRVNLELAALYLKQLRMRYKNVWSSVSAYNKGSLVMVEGQYFNQAYVDKVKKVYYKLEKQYE